MFRWLRRAIYKWQRREVMTPEMRRRSAETKQLNARLDALERQLALKERMSALEAGITEATNGSMEDQLILEAFRHFMPAIAQKFKMGTGQPGAPAVTQQVTDAQIDQVIDQHSELLKKIEDLGLSDDDIKHEISLRYPDTPADLVPRIVSRIRSRMQKIEVEE